MTQLLLSLPLGLSEEYSQSANKVAALEAEELERPISRLVHQDGYTEEEARKLRVEFLRFVSLKFVTNRTISPSPEVDEFWHAFILHTREYAEFCNRHFGEFFHHEPRDHNRTPEVRDPSPGQRTKSLINLMYPDHDRTLWAKTAICSVSHCDKK